MRSCLHNAYGSVTLQPAVEASLDGALQSVLRRGAKATVPWQEDSSKINHILLGCIEFIVSHTL
jgi:hypothetical protein